MKFSISANNATFEKLLVYTLTSVYDSLVSVIAFDSNLEQIKQCNNDYKAEVLDILLKS